jgi:hypothetical protein
MAFVLLFPIKAYRLGHDNGSCRILENSSGCWLSAPPPTGSAVHNEWLVFEFAAPVVISIVTLRWRTDNTPSHFSVAVSSDGTAYDTVAIITERSAASRIAIPKVGCHTINERDYFNRSDRSQRDSFDAGRCYQDHQDHTVRIRCFE